MGVNSYKLKFYFHYIHQKLPIIKAIFFFSYISVMNLVRRWYGGDMKEACLYTEAAKQ